MREDSHVTMTLAIANCPNDLQVIGVNGRERLNAPFCFDVDLVSPAHDLGFGSLLHRNAYLQMGTGTDNVHCVQGQVQEAQQLHRGQHLSLYRLRLAPMLQRLAGAPRRRVFNGLTVPQIITRLLQDHQIADSGFRFEPLIGIYPPREHCVQYAESDLHFLSRLCEEEGISFRFEHFPTWHRVVFSDDPVGFPEWPALACVDHLAEQFSVRNCYSTHAGEHYTPPSSHPPTLRFDADNQPRHGMDPLPRRLQQVRGRQLERLRCERRDILGRSVHPWLRSGVVIRVEDHPDPTFNDQWLLTEVAHSAWQLAPLRSCAAIDVIHILQAMTTATTCPGMGAASLLAPCAGHARPPLAGYENRFRVIPWATPFRPALDHPKPVFSGIETAIQTDDLPDGAGRVRIRYDWQKEAADDGSDDSWARIISGLDPQQRGARLSVRFFDGDCDQPIICGLADSGADADCGRAAPPLSPNRHTHLRIDSPTPLLLRGAHATLSITENGIHYAPQALHRPVGLNDV